LTFSPTAILVVEGRRQTAFSGESRTPSCAAPLRFDDIAANNTIFSYNIADASIQFVTHGTITDNQKKGLVQPDLDKVAPF